MKSGIIIGMALGMVTGAYIVSNNRKAKQLVQETQQKIMNKVEDLSQSMSEHGANQEAWN